MKASINNQQKQFYEIVHFIKDAQSNAARSINVEMINLYWNVGKYISLQISGAAWGDKTIDELAAFIQRKHPEIKGFNRRGLYRMKQFFETYSSAQIVSSTMTQLQLANSQDNIIVTTPLTQFEATDIRDTILTKINWSHHLIIISRTKTDEERDFYLNLCVKERYTVRELDRQIDSSVFERSMIGGATIAAKLKETHPDVVNILKDRYVIEFTGLTDAHNEDELQKGLVAKMKQFILELGRDFLSIGVLLCKDKDNEVVEYAMSRYMSPTMVSEYQTQLPDKKLLQQKLRELYG